jgi:plasmid stabilization system protein ParE
LAEFKIKFYPQSEKEIEETFDWYLQHSNSAAANFILLIDKRINEIKDHPKRYSLKK